MNNENMITPPKQLPKHLEIADRFAIDIIYEFTFQQLNDIVYHIRYMVKEHMKTKIIEMNNKIEEKQKNLSNMQDELANLKKILESM